MNTAFRLLPAIDLIGGRCVRLTHGDYAQQTTYAEDPLEQAQQFAAEGAEYLHLVDLDGAKAGAVQQWDVLKRICAHTHLKVDFSGGFQQTADLEKAFDLGAVQVAIGSLAAREPERFVAWIDKFGPERVVLSADARNGRIAVSGWLEATDHEVGEYIRAWHGNGVGYVACTDISKDGALAGPSFELYQRLQTLCPDLKIIASGGVTTAEDVRRLAEMGLDGAIVGKALYEGKTTVSQLIAALRP